MTDRTAAARLADRVAAGGLWAATLFTLALLLAILGFLLLHGLPEVTLDFLRQQPRDMGRRGGVGPLIFNTAYLAGLAVALATPLGVGTAIYLAEYQREGLLTRLVRFGADCLAGVPSILYGLFGFVFFVLYLGLRWSLLAGALTLAMMILPTIIRTSEEALRAVPHGLREVSLALGASRWQTVSRIVLPAALPGVLTGIILSIGRCVAETAAVLFTAGAALRAARSPLAPARTLAVHFYLLSREGLAPERAYATAAVLLLAVLALNLGAYLLLHAFRRRSG